MGFGPPESSAHDPEEIGSSPAGSGVDDPSSIQQIQGLGIHVRPPDHGASDMASGPSYSSYSSSPLNFTNRMIHFSVEYRDKNTNVVLPDNESVG